MNERIRELAEQANLEIDPAHPDHNQKVLEKFAELIVQDNIRTLRSNGYDDAAQCLQDIHFGIEDPI